MKYTLLAICCTCAVFISNPDAYAQSYVLNSSFEQFDQECPEFRSYPHLLD